jgi:hypothetical protein
MSFSKYDNNNNNQNDDEDVEEDETISFLTSEKRNIYIASLDEKNEPNIHPVWYYLIHPKKYFISRHLNIQRKKRI